MKAAGWKRWSQDASTSFNIIISRVKVYHWEQGCCRAVEGGDPCSIPDPTTYWALVSSHQDADTHTWFRMVPAPHEWKWLHQTEDYSLHFFCSHCLTLYSGKSKFHIECVKTLKYFQAKMFASKDNLFNDVSTILAETNVINTFLESASKFQKCVKRLHKIFLTVKTAHIFWKCYLVKKTAFLKGRVKLMIKVKSW